MSNIVVGIVTTRNELRRNKTKINQENNQENKMKI